MVFLNGLLVKPPHPKSPDFVKGRISIKRAELIESLSEMNDEWVNLDILVKKDGSGWYPKINEWKPDQQAPQAPQGYAPQAGWPPAGFTPPVPPVEEPYDHKDSDFDASSVPF